MTDDNSGKAATGAGLFSSRMMWAGFALAALIDSINGLHTSTPPCPIWKSSSSTTSGSS